MKKIGQIILAQKTSPKDSEINLSPEHIDRLRNLLAKVVHDMIPDFTYDTHNTNVFKNLYLYFTNQIGEYDLSKGLWLMGGNGTGKTSMLKMFSEFGRRQYKAFKIYDSSKVANDYAMNGDLDLYTYNQLGYNGKAVNMAFDELGREAIPSNHYGQKLNVMQHILHIRYNLWISEGVKTYITTNCDAVEIHNLYDNENDRFISDRIREMYNIIHLGGQSRRK